MTNLFGPIHPTGEHLCLGCFKEEDLRFGYCFDCASKGEERAANRTVIQHIIKGVSNIRKGSFNYKFDFQWAWERLTKTGDYRKGGYFEREGYFK